MAEMYSLVQLLSAFHLGHMMYLWVYQYFLFSIIILSFSYYFLTFIIILFLFLFICQAHLNTSFKHLIYFVNEFNLIDKRELTPMQELIDKMLKD